MKWPCFLPLLLPGVLAFGQGAKKPPEPTPQIQALINAAEKLPKDQIQSVLDKTIARAHQIGDKAGEAAAENALGCSAYSRGQQDDALRHFKQAFSLWQGIGNRTRAATTANNIGSALWAQSQSSDATNYFGFALRIQREVGDLVGEAATVRNIATVYDQEGQRQQALQYYAKARSIQRAAKQATALEDIGLIRIPPIPRVVPAERHRRHSVEFSSDGDTMLCSTEVEVHRWLVSVWHLSESRPGSTYRLTSLGPPRISLNAKQLIWWDANNVYFGDPLSGKAGTTLQVTSAPVDVRISRDSKLVAVVDHDSIKICSVASAQLLSKVDERDPEGLTVGFTTQGRLAVVVRGMGVKIFDPTNGEQTVQGFEDDQAGQRSAVQPTDRSFVSVDGRFAYWERQKQGRGPGRWSVAFGDLEQGKCFSVDDITGPNGWRLGDHRINSVLSPDEKNLLMAGDGFVLRDHIGSFEQLEHDVEDRGINQFRIGADDALFESPGTVFESASMVGNRIVATTDTGDLFFLDNGSGKELCRMSVFDDGSWAVYDPQGRFDSSDGGNAKWLTVQFGDEELSMAQLKQRYHQPGLLAAAVSGASLPNVQAFGDPKVPSVEVMPPPKGSFIMTVRVTDMGGGIGPLDVTVNGAPLPLTARVPISTKKKEVEFKIDLRASAYRQGQANTIAVQGSNAAGITTRNAVDLWTADGPTEKPNPKLFVVACGIDRYAGDGLGLRLAGKDALDFYSAMKVASTHFFSAGADLRLLTNPDVVAGTGVPAVAPTKQNLLAAITEAVRHATLDDTLVLFLSGHGESIKDKVAGDEYYYLTAEAVDGNLADAEVRKARSLSFSEILSAVNSNPKLCRRFIVLDTCASGEALKDLSRVRDVASDQDLALERLRDSAGFWVLAGCAADKVSYEAGSVDQGLLTYSVLEGFRGPALRSGDELDVERLCNFAHEQVPILARGIGGIQQPQVFGVGTTFDIGAISKEDLVKIPRSAERKRILHPNFLCKQTNNDKPLHLSELLAKRLDALSDPHARGGNGQAAIWYVDAEDLEGAIQPTGIYELNGDSVTLSLSLNDKSYTVSGKASNMDEFLGSIVKLLEK